MIPKKIVMILITLAAPLLLVVLSLSGCQTTPTPTPTQTAQVSPTIIAQPVLRCAPADAVIAFLEKNYNEKPMYSGIFNSSILLTVFVSEARTFTVVHTGIQTQISCLVSSGNNFKKLDWDKENNKSV